MYWEQLSLKSERHLTQVPFATADYRCSKQRNNPRVVFLWKSSCQARTVQAHVPQMFVVPIRNYLGLNVSIGTG